MPESKVFPKNMHLWDELLSVISEHKLHKDDFCITGSFALHLVGIRESRDIDIIIRPAIRSQIIPHKTAWMLSENIEAVGESWAKQFGISDDELIDNSLFHSVYNGVKVVRLELVLSKKLHTRREKDLIDIAAIGEYIPRCCDWNWNLVYEQMQIKPDVNCKGHLIKNYYRVRSIARSTLSLVKAPQKVLNITRNCLNSFLLSALKCKLKLQHQEICEAGPIIVYPIPKLLSKQYNGNIFDRMDIFVRYIAIECYFGQNNYGFQIYNKMQLRRVQDERSERFRTLIRSVDESGLDINSKVIIDPSGRIIDGAHRIALAIYYEEPVISVEISPYENEGGYNIEWFKQNNFEAEMINTIESKSYEIFQKLGMYFYIILWPPVKEYFDEIEEDISKLFRIIDSKTYTLNESFDMVLRELYNIDDIEKWKIERKIYAMQPYPKVVRIITIEIPDPKFRKKALNNHDLSMVCEDLKKKYREIYSPKVPNYIYDIIIHTGDNYEHNRKITEIIEKYLNQVKFDPTG